LDGHFIGNARGRVRYVDPLIELQQLSIQQNGSTLSGNVSFNRTTNALKFTARVNSVNLDMFRGFGLPETITGIIRQADLQGDGSIDSPNIRGSAALQNVSVNGETFSQVRMDLTSAGPKLDVTLDAGRNMNVKAQIDTATKGYPFTARASFTQYSLEHLAKLAEGTLTAS